VKAWRERRQAGYQADAAEKKKKAKRRREEATIYAVAGNL